MLIRPASPATEAPLMSNLPARMAAVPLALLLAGLPWACKRKSAPASAASAAPPPSGSSAALPGPEQLSRCRKLAAPGLTIEPDAPAPGRAPASLAQEDEEDDDATRLPFGVDTAAAVTLPSGFAVAGIRGAGQVFVAVLGEAGSRRVDLGEVHGDVEAPALAVAGERVLVALRSSDAAGFTLKLGQIAAASGGIEWGAELGKLGKLVSSVDLAAEGARGLVVLQSEDAKHSSRVLLGSFATADLKQPFEVAPLESKDVELPRLTPRPGGYWLTWVRSLPEAKTAPKPKPDAGAEDPEERDLLEQGLRVVEVLKLDGHGKPQGAALRLGEPRRQLLLFDVAPSPAGGLWVAVRSDTAEPGVEGGAILLSEVMPDGSVRDERLEDDEIGAGAPLLLWDPGAQPAELWLSVSSPSDATRLGYFRGARTYLQADPLLGQSEVIAVRKGRFLTQRARGRGVEFSSLECQLPVEAPAEPK
jgi:hypothetical protein